MRKFKDVRDSERIWVRAFTGDSSHTWTMTKEVRQINVSIYKRDDLVVKLNGFDLNRFIVFGVSQIRAIMVRRDTEGDLSRVEKNGCVYYSDGAALIEDLEKERRNLDGRFARMIENVRNDEISYGK